MYENQIIQQKKVRRNLSKKASRNMKEEVVKLFLDKIQRLGAHPKHYGKTNVFEFDMIVEYPLKK